MKYCTHCGKKMADEADFCTTCGCALAEHKTQRKNTINKNNQNQVVLDNGFQNFENRLSVICLLLGILGLVATIILYSYAFSDSVLLEYLYYMCEYSGLFVCGFLAILTCNKCNGSKSLAGFVMGIISVFFNIVFVFI